MSWLWRGFQSAVFHYVSCAPCTSFMYRRKRRHEAKKHERARRKMYKDQLEHKYAQPGPTCTNPYWSEEIAMGPGPPPQRAGRRTNTGSNKSNTPVCHHGALGSQAGSSTNNLRLSDEDPDDDNWNRRRYQREDEELWGREGPWLSPTPSAAAKGPSVGLGITRPGTSKSSADSNCSCNGRGSRHKRSDSPVIVSMQAVQPSDCHWMLQPPPKASIMSGKERATRSRSGSGASSRVELGLQRQCSSRHALCRHESGGTISHRCEIPKSPLGRTHSSTGTSSPGKRKRHDAETTPSNQVQASSGDHENTSVRAKGVATNPRATPPVSFAEPLNSSSHIGSRAPSPVASLRVTRTRTHPQRLSTVISSGSEGIVVEQTTLPENQRRKHRSHTASTQSSDSNPYLMMKHRTPLGPSDISSLNVLQDLVPSVSLSGSRFASSPLPEARIILPPADPYEEYFLDASRWPGSGFAVSRGWGTDVVDAQPMRNSEGDPSTESLTPLTRDPRMRWSNIF